ncbi:hypothetical protein Tco_1402687 [Tanacetum coccineum]
MPSARSQSTNNGSKPKPRINNQKSRNWPALWSSLRPRIKSLCHSRNTLGILEVFLTPNILFAPCQKKCVFTANHDSCVTKFLNEVNSRTKVPSNKTTKRYIPVEQTSFAKKPERQIPNRHRSSITKTSVVHEKIMTLRSCLRWKPTGKIFRTVGLRWVPTGKIFTPSTTKFVSEGTSILSEDHLSNLKRKKSSLAPPRQMTSDHNSSELGIQDHSNELSSSKLVPKVIPPADKTTTSRQELELLFHHHITMLRMSTKIELPLEQSQQGVSNDVLVSIEGVEELKEMFGLKGEQKEALLLNLAEKPGLIHMLFRILLLIADSEDKHHGPVIWLTRSPTHYPCDSARTSRVILSSIYIDEWKILPVVIIKSTAARRSPLRFEWRKTLSRSFFELPVPRIHKDGDGDASFQLESDSLPHAHAQTTKTFHKHQDSRIMKDQELKTKDFPRKICY